MKKCWVLLLGFLLVVSLTACGSKDKNWNVGSNGWNLSVVDWSSVIGDDNLDPLSQLRDKTPLTIDDLNKIDTYKFPISYTYTVYGVGDWWGIETWEYIYPTDVEYKFLLPMYENMASRKIVSSVMDHGRINTSLDVTLENWEVYSVTYLNNPNTLEYISATVFSPTKTWSYSFVY